MSRDPGFGGARRGAHIVQPGGRPRENREQDQQQPDPDRRQPRQRYRPLIRSTVRPPSESTVKRNWIAESGSRSGNLSAHSATITPPASRYSSQPSAISSSGDSSR